MACNLAVCTVNVHQLAAIVRNRIDNVLILDSRSFLEYNSSHVVNAINVGCAKLMKRRLQQEKLSIQDFLAQNCHWEVEGSMDIIVYDQNSHDGNSLPPDSFMGVFLQKLLPVYNSVNILKGGFCEFVASYPNLCESEKTKFPPMTSLSQPCLPISNHGPTRILPFLYLGSQHDALNKEILQNYNITYELNVSTNCPKPDFIQDSHFMRISVIDNYSEKLLPHFTKAFQFLDKVKESGGCVLVHCLAGISRSATVAIAYVMKTLKMSSDEAYRYVKAKRTTISPNFNFLGQLLEYEKQLQKESPASASPVFSRLNINSDENRNATSSQFSQQSNFTSYFSVNSSISVSSHASSSVSTHTFEMSKNRTHFQEKFDIACVPDGHTTAFKCLPVSALKEISCTPCQVSSFNSNQCVPLQSEKLVLGNVRSVHGSANHKKHDLSPSSGSYSSLSPELQDLKSFEFDPKSYVRSDSLSTSGLGSEGSDCTDSWNDYPAEKETDILMDDDYGTVPTQDFHQSKVLGFDDSYDEPLSLYPKYELPYRNLALRQHYHGYVNVPPIENVQMMPKTCIDTKCSSNTDSNCLISAQNEACSKELGKAHPLYRAQSCPGMLSTESPRAASIDRLSKNGAVALRKPRPKTSEKDRYHNRYSCSSLDYMDYSTSSDFSHVICPDSIEVAAGASDSSSVHRNYRHSMIQVS